MTMDGRKRRQWMIGASVAVAAVFGPGVVQFVRLSLEQRRLDWRLSQLSAEHERLTQEERRIHTDPTYVEGLIRSTFKLAQPGEFVIPLESRQSHGDRR